MPGDTYFLKENIDRLKQVKEFSRILVIGDLNIGDAINLQAAISGLRDCFPDSEMHYVTNRSAVNLIDGNSEISTLWPVFAGTPFPNENDLKNINKIVSEKRYNVIINFCPFIKETRLFGKDQKVINYFPLALILVREQ